MSNAIIGYSLSYIMLYVLR